MRWVACCAAAARGPSHARRLFTRACLAALLACAQVWHAVGTDLFLIGASCTLGLEPPAALVSMVGCGLLLHRRSERISAQASSHISTRSPHELPTISSRAPHELPTISSRAPHDLLTISSRSPHDLLTISHELPMSSHELPTISSRAPHDLLTISSRSPHDLLTISHELPTSSHELPTISTDLPRSAPLGTVLQR